MKALLVVAAIGACMAGGQALAAMTVLGGGEAQECFKAARDGKSDHASVETCTKALDTEAMSPEDRGGTFVNRGVMELRQGEYETAHADFDEGIRLNPRIGEGFANRGAMFIGERRYKEALADIDKALELGMHEPAKGYFDRALAYEGLDDEQSAYLDYQQALVLQPGWDLPQHELLRFTVTRR